MISQACSYISSKKFYFAFQIEHTTASLPVMHHEVCQFVWSAQVYSPPGILLWIGFRKVSEIRTKYILVISIISLILSYVIVRNRVHSFHLNEILLKNKHR